MNHGRRQQNNKFIKYSICVLGLTVLLVAAVLGPQLVFSVQDKYRMDTTWQGKRSSLDIEALNHSYDSLQNRFTSFAEGLANHKNYYVTGTDYQVTEETYTLLEQVFSQEAFWLMHDWGMIPFYPLEELYKAGYAVEKCKKYVIYDDTFEDGVASVAVMAWYMEIRFSDDSRIKILMDTENQVLYYIECSYSLDGEVKDKINIVSLYIPVYETEFFADIADQCYSYYEAEASEISQWHIDEEECYVALPYGKYTLDWEVKIAQPREPSNSIKVSMGIKEIGKLVPELAD